MLAFVGLVITAPMILLAAALIKLTSRGPAFYTQVRVGKNGRRPQEGLIPGHGMPVRTEAGAEAFREGTITLS